MAEGTDFHALPFFRIDRTTPGVVQVDVPPILMTWDTFPSAKSEDEIKGQDAAPRGELAPSRTKTNKAGEPERDYLVRFPWPFGTWIKRGDHRFWTYTGFILAQDTGSPGPAGRALSTDGAVRKDPFTALASDPESGGILSLPFVYANTTTDHEDHPGREDRTDIDHDIHLWPIFVYGSGEQKGLDEERADDHDYFALFPFGGVTKGLLGKEKITWFGFPYPLYAHVRDRSYESHHVLFPLVNWVSGPQNSGFRVLPFFGHYERTGLKGEPIYTRTFVLWPFLTWSTSGMNEPVPTETFFLFPFFGRQTGYKFQATSILWPFFKYTTRQTDEGDDWEVRAPFPFLQFGASPTGWKFDMWPLFGVKERGKTLHRHFFAWPIWRYESLNYKSGRSFSGQWLLPFFWRTRWDDVEGTSQHKWRLYPFLHYRKYRDGSLDIGGLSPYWFDDAGFQRTLGSFMTLYRYQRDSEGGTQHDFLLGLLGLRDRPPSAERAAYSRLSFLFGLFQYRNLGGERGLRFLWLLPEIRWGGES
ncbi:MAG: hypothetical protein JKY65_18075 [Planctomycetes bacterium]|nr:hypothetical protein [Planctomycetota bacterium]